MRASAWARRRRRWARASHWLQERWEEARCPCIAPCLEAELADIEASGVFRVGGNSSAFGKWFAERAEDAAEWGRRFGEPFYIVESSISKKAASRMFRIPNLDGIGPARFAEREHLPLFGPIRMLPSIPLGR